MVKNVQFLIGSLKQAVEHHFDPRHEKTCLLGFRAGPIQTRLYSHRSLLEA